jgi:hypothetical protein
MFNVSDQIHAGCKRSKGKCTIVTNGYTGYYIVYKIKTINFTTITIFGILNK